MDSTAHSDRPARRKRPRGGNPNFRTDAIYRLESRMRRNQRTRPITARRWRLSEAELNDLVEQPEHLELLEERA